MAGSAFNLSSGIGSDGTSIRAIKQQTSHGFVAGNVVCFVLNETNDGATGNFELANASGITSAEAIGIIESVDGAGHEFTVVYSGEINTNNFVSVNGQSIESAGGATQDVWFLDPTIAGGLTAYAPSASGQIIKPVLTLVSGFDDGDKGLVTNYLGTVIGGSNTVSLESVQPVGEIIAFGGETNDIPAGWQLCDGSTVDTETYASYYSRVGTKYGYNVSLTVTHGGTVFVAGQTCEQRFDGETDVVQGNILSWSGSGDGITGALVVDPDVLRNSVFAGSGQWGTDGAEHRQDNLGYPHGYDFDNAYTLFYKGAYSGTGLGHGVVASTITHAKTPDLRGRTILGALEEGTSPPTSLDGYTAGQMSGAEDAVGVQVAAGSATWVYSATSAAAASIIQPYLASHYLIRIDDTAKAALVDGIVVALDDDGLTDHYTPDASHGDINVYDPLVNEAGNIGYKNLKLFDNYPRKVSNFESKFKIITSDTGDDGDVRVGIGLSNPQYDLHMRKDEAVRIVLEDLNGVDPSTRMFLQASGTQCYIQAYSNSILNFRVNNKGVMRFNVQEGADGTPDADSGSIELGGIHDDMICPVDIDNVLTVGDGLTVHNDAIISKQNIQCKGQVYSLLHTSTDLGTWNPSFDNGNVQLWDHDNQTDLNMGNPVYEKEGGMYALVFKNGNNAPVTFGTWGSRWTMANGIFPNIIRANSSLVISIICVERADNGLLCTWAEDYADPDGYAALT